MKCLFGSDCVMPARAMDTRGHPSPRPTPHFYSEPVTFSVKKVS